MRALCWKKFVRRNCCVAYGRWNLFLKNEPKTSRKRVEPTLTMEKLSWRYIKTSRLKSNFEHLFPKKTSIYSFAETFFIEKSLYILKKNSSYLSIWLDIKLRVASSTVTPSCFSWSPQHIFPILPSSDEWVSEKEREMEKSK